MLHEITELSPLFAGLSALVSILSLTVAFVAFRRTSRLQDIDYRPHVALSLEEPYGCTELNKDTDDEEEHRRDRNLAVVLSGKIMNAGPKLVHLSRGRVLLGPQHRDDLEKALTVSFSKTLGTGAECPFSFTLRWGTIWDVAQYFSRTSIDCYLAISARGADGVTREIKRYLGQAMRCEGNEWAFIGPSYFTETLNDLQQARLQHKLNPQPTDLSKLPF